MTDTIAVRAQTLSGIRIFAGLDATARAGVANRCHGHRVAAGTAILLNNEDSRHVYGILSGRVRATIFSRGGREVSFRDLGPGDLFGDLAAIDGKPRSATVVALERCELIAIPDAVFRSVLASNSEVAFQMLCELTALIRDLSDRVVEFSTLGVKNRIHAEILRLARGASEDGQSAAISRAPTHSEIANRISTHREAVTREVRSLAKQGLVRKKSGSLYVYDIPRLARMVAEGRDH
jgi:CRP-like cAMP-binding protein